MPDEQPSPCMFAPLPDVGKKGQPCVGCRKSGSLEEINRIIKPCTFMEIRQIPITYYCSFFQWCLRSRGESKPITANPYGRIVITMGWEIASPVTNPFPAWARLWQDGQDISHVSAGWPSCFHWILVCSLTAFDLPCYVKLNVGSHRVNIMNVIYGEKQLDWCSFSQLKGGLKGVIKLETSIKIKDYLLIKMI